MPVIGIGIGVCYRGSNPGGAAPEPPAWSPLELSPVLWLKADAGTFQTSGGIAALAYADPVGEWQDQSGLGHHVTAPTEAKRPALITGAQNGLPGIRFDGVDDHLRALFTGNQPFTRFFVLKNRSAADGNHVICSGGTAVSYLYYSGATTLTLSAGASLSTAASASAVLIARATYNGAASKIGVNAGTVTTGAGGAGSPGGLTLAADEAGLYLSDLDLFEVLVFPSAVADADVTLTLGYLNGRWAIY